MPQTVDWQEIERQYRAIDLPAPTQERMWIDRLRTWDDFVRNGERVADLLRDVAESKYTATTAESMRDAAPALFDLLERAFGPVNSRSARAKAARASTRP